MAKNQLKSIVIKIIKSKPSTETDLLNIARGEAGKLKLPPPQKSALLAEYRRLVKDNTIKPQAKIERLLIKRAVRTLSGVAVISVLTKPQSCPGNCLFCPTEYGMPKSYLSNEPAVMRAILNGFDPYRQVEMRLAALSANGHPTDKIELIIMGGTWSAHSPKYQSWFIKKCLEALNGKTSKSLTVAQKQNETVKRRLIGLTLETRPDFITGKEIKRLRELGCTRVELGVQHTDDKILKLNRRGHTAAQGLEAIRRLKNAGFKINLHLMLNMYGSTPSQDFKMFEKIYTDSDWMPDMVKIYPCVVNEHADLYKLYKQGKYKPYTKKQLANLIIKIKKITPPWVRITRLIRDIPEESIIAGNKTTNLRQLIGEQAKKDGWQCQCIRCREAGHQQKKLRITNYELRILKYHASGGTEYFLSFESPDKKVLYAFLRLRLNSSPFQGGGRRGYETASKPPLTPPWKGWEEILPELQNAAIIRELHTYGQLAELGKSGEVQHLGLGKKLITEAEKISRQNGYKKIAVISGIGVREYYRKLGYGLEGTYMVKNF